MLINNIIKDNIICTLPSIIPITIPIKNPKLVNPIFLKNIPILITPIYNIIRENNNKTLATLLKLKLNNPTLILSSSTSKNIVL